MLFHGTDRSANATALNVIGRKTKATLGSEETGLTASVHMAPTEHPDPLPQPGVEVSLILCSESQVT